jgi:hypothetical protein
VPHCPSHLIAAHSSNHVGALLVDVYQCTVTQPEQT